MPLSKYVPNPSHTNRDPQYGTYGKYSRTAEAEAEIEALLELAMSIKTKREAEFQA